ncbi:MAG: DUF4145 domain-containing protein [Candidatus Methylomirabilales bacterium]
MNKGDKRTFLCAGCGVLSLHIAHTVGEGPHEIVVIRGRPPGVKRPYGENVKLFHVVYKCVGCGKDTYLLIRPPVQEIPEKVIHQFPVGTPTTHPSVPGPVKEAANEAEKCLAIGANNACGVMARRAIHALCQDKKAKGKDLPKQLKYLHDNQVIAQDLREWADDLRILGRSGAHPEWPQVSPQEAKYAVEFLREIIRYVYINPAERAAQRVAEVKKKKKGER